MEQHTQGLTLTLSKNGDNMAELMSQKVVVVYECPAGHNLREKSVGYMIFCRFNAPPLLNTTTKLGILAEQLKDGRRKSTRNQVNKEQGARKGRPLSIFETQAGWRGILNQVPGKTNFDKIAFRKFVQKAHPTCLFFIPTLVERGVVLYLCCAPLLQVHLAILYALVFFLFSSFLSLPFRYLPCLARSRIFLYFVGACVFIASSPCW